MKRFDCIIVGAGPAGTSAAIDLAEMGCAVLLLEKQAVPVPICAGGLTAKVSRALGEPLDGVPMRRCYTLEVRLQQQVVWLTSTGTLANLSAREDVDGRLRQRALAKGCELKTPAIIESIHYQAPLFSLDSNLGRFQAPFLIGADGVNSQVNRRFKLVSPWLCGLAAMCTCNNRPHTPYTHPVFTFGLVPGGYAWLFPRGDAVCVGAYSTQPALTGIKELVLSFARDKGLSCRAHEIKGKIVPFYGISYRQPDLPCILTGDAAGFVDYTTGEGIAHAITSGRLAAAAVRRSLRAGAFSPLWLQRRYNRHIIRHLRLSYRFGRRFYRHMPAWFARVCRPLVLKTLMVAATQGLDNCRILHRLPWLLLRAAVSPGRARYGRDAAGDSPVNG